METKRRTRTRTRAESVSIPLPQELGPESVSFRGPPSRGALHRYLRAKGYDSLGEEPAAVLTSIVRAKLLQFNPETGNLMAEDIVERWLVDALKGRYHQLRELLDRVEGRVPPGRDDREEHDRTVVIQYVNDWRSHGNRPALGEGTDD